MARAGSAPSGGTREVGGLKLPLSAALLLGILLLAAALRTWQMDLVEFKQDESSWLWLAADLLDKGTLPQIGSVGLDTTNTLGMHIPPLMAYVMAVPLLFSRDPVVATGFVALLNVVGVGLLYWLARRYFGWLESNLAALFLAVSPIAVFYSRKVWSNYILAPFTLLLFLALYALFVEKRRWALAAAIFLVSWCIQLHPSSTPLAVCLLILAVVFRRDLSWRPALVGALAGAAIWLPYLSFVWQTGGNELTRAIAFFGVGKSTIDAGALLKAMELVTTEHTEVGASIAAPWWMPKYRTYFWLDYLWLGLLALGLVLALWRWLRPSGVQGSQRIHLILLVWVVVPILMDTRHSIDVQRFYLLPIQPALFLLIAMAVAGAVKLLWHRAISRAALSRLGRLAYGGLLAMVCVVLTFALWSQAFAFVEFLRWAEAGNAVKAFGFPPLRYELDAARKVATQLPPTDPVVFIPADKDTPKVFAYLLRDRQPTFEPFTFSDALALPLDRGDGVYLIPSTRTPVLNAVRRVLPSQSWTTVSSGGGEMQFVLQRGGQSSLTTDLAESQMNAASSELAIGLRLVSWQALPPRQPDRALTGLLLFEVTGAPEDAGDYHLFDHLLDSSGNKIAQLDTPTIPVANWRLRERRLMAFTMALPANVPAGEYRMSVGAYDLKTMQRVPVRDASTGQASDTITLGPILLP